MMLTAKAGTAERIHGLELGADDYVTKPFSPREVVLRARAILRRATGDPASEEPASYGGGQLLIDEARHRVFARQPGCQPVRRGVLGVCQRAAVRRAEQVRPSGGLVQQ